MRLLLIQVLNRIEQFHYALMVIFLCILGLGESFGLSAMRGMFSLFIIHVCLEKIV